MTELNAGSAVHQLKCSLHASREAVARCPSCTRFYCRECVVEHQGRMLCSACLEEESEEKVEKKSNLLSFISAGACFVVSFFITWLMFYWLGLVLRAIPEDFHDNPAEYALEVADEAI